TGTLVRGFRSIYELVTSKCNWKWGDRVAGFRGQVVPPWGTAPEMARGRAIVAPTRAGNLAADGEERPPRSPKKKQPHPSRRLQLFDFASTHLSTDLPADLPSSVLHNVAAQPKSWSRR